MFLRRSVDHENQISAEPLNHSKYSYCIVIPVFNEYDYIIKTLKSINNQSKKYLQKLLVILNINNSTEDSLIIKENNYQTHQLINNQKYKYSLIIIDNYSKKNAFKKKHSGVGIARKIGMDFALQFGFKNSLLCCLDADTLIHKDYLKQISQIFKNTKVSKRIEKNVFI